MRVSLPVPTFAFGQFVLNLGPLVNEIGDFILARSADRLVRSALRLRQAT